MKRSKSGYIGKYPMDRICAAIALVLLSPLLGLLALLVRWKLGSPVFFRRQRPGYQGRAFLLVKFRSMTNACDLDGRFLPDSERLAPFGKFLRSSSLDELPELWNVLKGEMSLVGPRPLLMEYLPRYTPVQARRHEVRPGITGWAQVNGRNTISWEEKFRLDLWYVDHCSLWIDLKILFLTVCQVFQRKGINADGHATMPLFEGNDGELNSGQANRSLSRSSRRS